MPSRQTHTGIALIIPFLILLIVGSKVLHSSTFIINSILVVLGSLAPDFLEPAHYWNHRSFFHSQKLLKILLITTGIIGFFEIIFYSIFQSQIFLFIISFLVGYILHLLLDFTTKMGLPSESKPSKPIGFIQSRPHPFFLGKLKKIKKWIGIETENREKRDFDTEKSKISEKDDDSYYL
jgi:hypothetical protein